MKLLLPLLSTLSLISLSKGSTFPRLAPSRATGPIPIAAQCNRRKSILSNPRLCAALSGVLLLSVGCSLDAGVRAHFGPRFLAQTESRIVLSDGRDAESGGIRLMREWKGNVCRSRLTNEGQQARRIKEIVLFAVPQDLPPETRLYGEGFTMLSQTGGILGKPVDIGSFTDRGHYKIPQPPDALTVYSMLMTSPPEEDHTLLAFTSCHRFSGAFRLRGDSIEVVLDTENLELAPGESWQLEEFMASSCSDRHELLTELADRLNAHHPRRPVQPIPVGWCSWYCFGPEITAGQMYANLDVIARDFPQLRYVQLDDGFQPAMGDWLETRPGFGDLRELCRRIRGRGHEPAVWLAPFIAGAESRVFQEHPEWFIQDAEGKPLRSDRVSFGGWRLGPWYALDGTHPGTQKHLEQIFRTLHEDFGCTYFKLDALFWGALHGGRLHDRSATRIEAYRRGMRAMLRGAGDSFVLGCNHPLWPSLGLVDGSRSSNDIGFSWDSIHKTAREALYRNWQHNRLWFNDPDVVLLRGDQSEADLQFRATITYATAGMLLAGDDLTELPPERAAMLGKLIPPPGEAARFEDDTFQVGIIDRPTGFEVCLFNWGDDSQDLSVTLPAPSRIKDFWSGRDLGIHEGIYRIKDMPPHSARLLVCVPHEKP